MSLCSLYNVITTHFHASHWYYAYYPYLCVYHHIYYYYYDHLINLGRSIAEDGVTKGNSSEQHHYHVIIIITSSHIITIIVSIAFVIIGHTTHFYNNHNDQLLLHCHSSLSSSPNRKLGGIISEILYTDCKSVASRRQRSRWS